AHVLAALKRALAPEPDARFADMDALLDALARAPKRRLRWPVVLGVSGLALAGVFVAAYTVGLGKMVEENMAAGERSRDADARRDDAMVAELLATVERDPSATLTRLTELRTNAPAWSTTVWSLAQTIADTGAASDIVELPDAGYYTRFAGARLVSGHDGDDSVMLDYETGAARSEVADATIPPGCDHLVRSDDEAWLAASCGTKTRAWHPSTKREVVVATKGELVHVDRDGAHVLTRAGDGAWRRWDLATPSSTSPAVVAPGALRAYDEPRARALVAEGGMLAIVDLVRGTVAHSTIAAEIETAAFAPDGRTLAIGTHAGELWWLDLADADATPQRGRDALGERIAPRVWSQDGAMLLARSSNGTARVFDGAGRAARMTVRDPDPIHDARWIDDTHIETLSSTSVRRWAIAGPRVLGRDVAGVASCSDGTTIVGLSSGAITRDGEPVARVEGLRGVVASPDCRTIAAIGERSLAIVGTARTIATAAFAEDVAIADDTLVWRERCELRVLALGSEEPRTIAPAAGRCFDGVAIVGDTVLTADGPVDARGETLRRFALRDGSEREAIALGFAIGRFAAVPSTGALAIASDDGVVLFDPATHETRTLGLAGELVLAVAASDDGQWIAAQPFRGRLRIWHTATGNEYAAPLGASTIAAEAMRPWMVGPLRTTGPAAFTYVDPDRTAFTVAVTVPTDGVGLREWVGAHLPQRRQVPARG
ncbi:MAG TPA: hypothetical protein VG755_21025, partial [Nannocystaceae bacterium]|nr:hypothetical protein [Nannocystaceae bacterium]